MIKKRVLVVNEFSKASTGFSNYMAMILPLLHANPNIHLAELATYCGPMHPNIMDQPWTVYPNEPDPRLGPEVRKEYDADQLNQFGKYSFDRVCLEFKPHIVITIRDPWHDNWIIKSAFRDKFKWISMPTCDGEPQKTEWLNEYTNVDVLLTYSEWAKNVFEDATHGKLKVFGVASPPVDTAVFYPRDKKKLREKFGLNENAFIVSTVMRNQPRKLFPDLLRSFVKFLQLCEANGNHDLAANTYLHCHTTQPDMGWDLPTEIRRHNLSHKVIFTYMCEHCGNIYTHFYKGERAQCLKCNNLAARFPNTAFGVSREQLAELMGISDLYIQYATNGGWEMGIGDSKAVGVPVLCTEYSAMTEQANAPGGLPVPVKRYFQEPVNQTAQLRALPDNDATAEIIYDLFTHPEKLSAMATEGVDFILNHYTPEHIAKIWSDAIDHCQVDESAWFGPPNLINTSVGIPGNLDSNRFVYWCYANLLKKPQDFFTWEAQKIVSVLNIGYESGHSPDGKPTRHPVTQQSIANYFMNRAQYHNMWESKRLGIERKQEFVIV